MRKKTYYLFKEILPNLLLSIFLLLLFDVLNFRVEITRAKYIVYLSILYTLFSLLLSYILNFIWALNIRKTDILTNLNNSLIQKYIILKLFNLLLNIIIFALTGLIYSRYILVEGFYILLLIGFSIEILKIVLNKIYKFDTILLRTGTKPLDEEIAKLLKEIEECEKQINKDNHFSNENLDIDELVEKVKNQIKKKDDKENKE